MVSSLVLRKQTSYLWLVFSEDAPVAEIHLDPFYQVKLVLIEIDVPEDAQTDALRLVLSHALQFAPQRLILPNMRQSLGALNIQHPIGRTDSDWLMTDLDTVPREIAALDKGAVLANLLKLRIGVFTAVHETIEDALRSATAEAGVESLCVAIFVPSRQGILARTYVKFSVKKPSVFTFCKAGSQPVADSLEAFLINGSTDAHIGGQAIRAIYCPGASRTGRMSAFGSWEYVKHPDRALGRSFVVEIDGVKMRTAAGVEETAKLLRAALGLDKTYVAVSGGFNPPS